MQYQNLYFNILTFDWPKEKQTFYFGLEDIPNAKRLHRSQFPNQIEEIFPGITTDGTDFIFTTYDFLQEGFMPLSIDFKTENQYLICKYYNRRIKYYFKTRLKKLVRTGFIGETQVWIHANELSEEKFDVYYKFSLKIQLANVTSFPEIVLSYDGKSKVFKESTSSMVKNVSHSLFNWVIKENKLLKYEELVKLDDPGYHIAYPVLNSVLAQELNIEPEQRSFDSKYKEYRELIKEFHKNNLDIDLFREIIPFHKEGFLKVPGGLINNVPPGSNELKFAGPNQGSLPKKDFLSKKPYKKVEGTVHLIFVYHENDEQTKNLIKGYMDKGLGHFKGLEAYAGILFHFEEKNNVCFQNRKNPLPELLGFFDKKFSRTEKVKYLAIYLTPFSMEESQRQEVRIYARVKQILLEREI